MSDMMLIDIYLCITFSSIIVHWITVLLYACYHFTSACNSCRAQYCYCTSVRLGGNWEV